MMREAATWGNYANLNATVQSRVREAASCDSAMYEDALRRLGLHLPITPMRAGVALDRARCADADYARGLTTST